MHCMELLMRQNADTAREQAKLERRKDNMKHARKEISVYLSQGMDRNIAINFVLDTEKYSILVRKEVRREFEYGCHTIYSMNHALSGINGQNSSDFVLEEI